MTWIQNFVYFIRAKVFSKMMEIGARLAALQILPFLSATETDRQDYGRSQPKINTAEWFLNNCSAGLLSPPLPRGKGCLWPRGKIYKAQKPSSQKCDQCQRCHSAFFWHQKLGENNHRINSAKKMGRYMFSLLELFLHTLHKNTVAQTFDAKNLYLPCVVLWRVEKKQTRVTTSQNMG